MDNFSFWNHNSFRDGHLIGGIVLALIIGIVDGLDGKQARIRVETSVLGKIEHRFDSFFEVVWPRRWLITSMSRVNCRMLSSTWLCSSWRKRSMALANWVFMDQPRSYWLILASSIESFAWSAATQYLCLGPYWLRCFGHTGKGADCHGILGGRNRCG
jgi:hypothetical protein